jgi:hypothetical protein
MMQKWTHTAIIQSAVLLVSEDTEINFTDESGEPFVYIAKPKRIDKPKWTIWDNDLPLPAWEYQVTFRHLEGDDPSEISLLANRQIESLAARLSFFTSAPVEIVSLGHVTNAPKEPVKGEEYTVIQMAAQQAMEFTYLPIESDQLQYLARLFAQSAIEHKNYDRIDRSMRWLQRSRLADSPTDEFTCLIIALENLSKLLSPSTKQFWRCSACKKDVESCPHCGKSTEHEGSGSRPLSTFVNDILKWPPGKWAKIWTLRNKVLHGSADLTLEDESYLLEHVVDLEAAVVHAIRHILHISHQSPPLSVRHRVPFYAAKLVISWTPGNDPDANQPDE